MQKRLEITIQTVIASPYATWVLMNIVVWSLGLYAIALCIRFLGIIGAPMGAIVMGGIVGIGQSWVLKRLLPISPRQWTSSSAIGVLLGVLPIALLFLWVLLVAVIGVNSVLLILGAIFGAIFGSIQARVLYSLVDNKAGWWIIINVIAGALCAPLSLTGTTFWLPIFCSLGPLTFGLLTAWGLRYILRSIDVDLK